MKYALPLPLIILALVSSAVAETPGSHGSPISMAAHLSALDEPDSAVRTTAAAFLAGYLQKQSDHPLCQIRLSGSAIWIELTGLRLNRLVAKPITPTDTANGITESWLVMIDYTSYRARNLQSAQWSKWSDAPNLLLPSAIRVEKRTDGHWQVNPKDFHLLTPLSTPSGPATIPHAAQPATAAQASK